MPKELIRIAPCSACGSEGKCQRQGSFFMIVPKQISKCELHKHPERRCGGSVSSMCRSGISTREDAIRQWNSMMSMTADVR